MLPTATVRIAPNLHRDAARVVAKSGSNTTRRHHFDSDITNDGTYEPNGLRKTRLFCEDGMRGNVMHLHNEI